MTAMTCVLVATLPMGVAQAQTTQNDYATACWLACLMCMALALLYDPTNLWYPVGAAGAPGLGVLTTATMVLFAGLLVGVLILVLLIRLRHQLRWRRDASRIAHAHPYAARCRGPAPDARPLINRMP